MKTFIGKVLSKKMAKTAVVQVRRYVIHPIYKKRLLRVKKYHVHDELNTKGGDEVKFVPCRPCSKTKNWRMVEVLKKGAKK